MASAILELAPDLLGELKRRALASTNKDALQLIEDAERDCDSIDSDPSYAPAQVLHELLGRALSSRRADNKPANSSGVDADTNVYFSVVASATEQAQRAFEASTPSIESSETCPTEQQQGSEPSPCFTPENAAAFQLSIDSAALPSVLSQPSPHLFTAAFTWAAQYCNEATKLKWEHLNDATNPSVLPQSLQPHIRLRYATAGDAGSLLRFIRELAEFEREPDAVMTSEAEFIRDGLTPAGLRDLPSIAARPPLFHALIAEVPSDIAQRVLNERGNSSDSSDSVSSSSSPEGAAASVAGGLQSASSSASYPSSSSFVPVAMAFAHPSYSTWEGRTLYLEDLYVSPPFRRRGVSKALFSTLAAAAAVSRCARLQWSVLTWNEGAVNAYDGMGAQRLEDWRLYRLCRGDIARVAGVAVPMDRPAGVGAS